AITHCAEVTAESLYEAAVLALAEFDRCRFTDAHTGSATRLHIAVLAPSTSHEISVGKVRAWLHHNGPSPAAQAPDAPLPGWAGKGVMPVRADDRHSGIPIVRSPGVGAGSSSTRKRRPPDVFPRSPGRHAATRRQHPTPGRPC